MNPLLEQAETLQNLLIGRATGPHNQNDEHEYKRLRQLLISEAKLETVIPKFVKTCRDLNQFWHYIKLQFETYAERRQFLWTEFQPLLELLEQEQTAPSDTIVSEIVEKVSAEQVMATWQKALDRRFQDPDGAITSARTLIESVCKHILDESGEEYDDGLVLPQLYNKTAELLNLAPSQHTEKPFKQILSGCISIVQGLGTIRNRMSDSHSPKKEYYVKPAPRHAELAVNVSGALASYLLNTWENKNNTNKQI